MSRQGLLLARPVLESRLREAVSGQRAVLVAAAAGYGKSALLVRALTPPPPRHGLAWISLDPGDDLHRLFEGLLAALDAFDLPFRTAPEGLLATAPAGDAGGRPRAVDELVNRLAATDLAQGTIVIDDVHQLTDEPAQQPASLDAAELTPEQLGPMSALNSAVSPWHAWLDRAAYGRHVDAVEAVGARTVASAHGPVLRGAQLDDAFDRLRGLAGARSSPHRGRICWTRGSPACWSGKRRNARGSTPSACPTAGPVADLPAGPSRRGGPHS